MVQDLQSKLENRNVTVAGHRTSLRLEQDVWSALEEICVREKLSVHEVCSIIEDKRGKSSRTAAVRAFILGYFRAAASDIGHTRAGHGHLRKKGYAKPKKNDRLVASL